MNIFEEFKQKAVQGDTKGNARLLYELVANHSNAISHYGIARGMPCDMYRLASVAVYAIASHNRKGRQQPYQHTG